MTPCGFANSPRHFGRACCLLHGSWRVESTSLPLREPLISL